MKSTKKPTSKSTSARKGKAGGSKGTKKEAGQFTDESLAYAKKA